MIYEPEERMDVMKLYIHRYRRSVMECYGQPDGATNKSGQKPPYVPLREGSNGPQRNQVENLETRE